MPISGTDRNSWVGVSYCDDASLRAPVRKMALNSNSSGEDKHGLQMFFFRREMCVHVDRWQAITVPETTVGSMAAAMIVSRCIPTMHRSLTIDYLPVHRQTRAVCPAFVPMSALRDCTWRRS